MDNMNAARAKQRPVYQLSAPVARWSRTTGPIDADDRHSPIKLAVNLVLN